MVNSKAFSADQHFQVLVQATLEGLDKEMGMNPMEQRLGQELHAKVVYALAVGK
jgi:hypothetical protein